MESGKKRQDETYRPPVKYTFGEYALVLFVVILVAALTYGLIAGVVSLFR